MFTFVSAHDSDAARGFHISGDCEAAPTLCPLLERTSFSTVARMAPGEVLSTSYDTTREVSIVQWSVSAMTNWLGRCLARPFVPAVVTLGVWCIDPGPVRFAAMNAHDGVEDSNADSLSTWSRSVQISPLSSLFCAFLVVVLPSAPSTRTGPLGSTCSVGQ